MRELVYVTVLTMAGAAGCAQVVDAPPSDTAPMCALLPDDGSACAHACDPGALQAFIPEGVCVTFDCPLTDGTSVRVGGCSL